MAKILRMKIYQPYAHYREPKVMQDDYIPTLPLPPATTIAGMVSYMIGRKLNSLIDIAVCGTYEKKEINFIRGEGIEFWNNYPKSYVEDKYDIKDSKEILIKYFNVSEDEIQVLNKKSLDELLKIKEELKKIEYLKNGENFIWYKTKLTSPPKTMKLKSSTRIMNFEVLSDVELIIYLKINDEKDFEDIKNSFEEMPYYMTLGRKEDFAVFRKGNTIEDITDKVEEREFLIEDSIIKNAKLKNSYIPVKLNEGNDDYFMNQGILYTLPLKYSDITKDKTERKIEHSHFIFIDSRGIYPKDKKIAVYENEKETEAFCWMLGL